MPSVLKPHEESITSVTLFCVFIKLDDKIYDLCEGLKPIINANTSGVACRN